VGVSSQVKPQQPRTIQQEAGMTKKALVVGIDKYKNPQYNLEGCTMDAAVMSGMLQDHFGFPGDNIRVLMDDRATKANMLERLDWLVKDAKPGDSMVFFYAGHGSQVRDRNGDELEDGMDEILCPHDLNWDDPLTDDILSEKFQRVPKGATLSVVFDCCNSGTSTRSLYAVMDKDGNVIGEPEYKKTRYIKPPLDIEHRSRGIMLKTRRIGEVVIKENHILMCACQSNQEAQEKRFGTQARGAFSYFFGEALKRANWQLSYRQAHDDTLVRLRDNGFIQVPQLEGPPELMDRQLFS
jgi:metacaspase-1